jgi:hypothetical protein
MALEQRKHLRYDFIVKIEYVSNPENANDILKGVTINISNSGLCLLTTHCLNIGQEISIKTVLPSFSQTAVVRWIRNYDDASYHAGLEFTP